MSKKIKIVIGLAIIVLIAVGGLWWFNNSERNTYISSDKDVELSPEEESLETYTNETRGFSIDYPTGWYISDFRENEDAMSFSSIPFGGDDYRQKEYINVQVQHHSKQNTRSLREIAFENRLAEADPVLENVKIAGRDAIKSNAIGQAMYFIPKSETEYFVVLFQSTVEQGSVEAIQNTISDMINSFTILK